MRRSLAECELRECGEKLGPWHSWNLPNARLLHNVRTVSPW